jgi:WD40 repeat protein
MFLNPSRHFSGEFVKVWRRAALGKPWKSVGTIAATVFNSNLISDLALSHDGKLLVVALNSNTPLQVFNTESLRLRKELPTSSDIMELVFSPDGHYLLGCGGNNVRVTYSRHGGVLYFWNLDTGDLEHTVSAPQLLRGPVFSPDGRRIGATLGDADVFVCQSPMYQHKN